MLWVIRMYTWMARRRARVAARRLRRSLAGAPWALAFAVASALVFSHTSAWLLGRNAEARLTLGFYNAASYAVDQLERCTGFVREMTEAEIEALPEWEGF